MQALLVVDAQNEFSPAGRRPVPNHAAALAAICRLVGDARRDERPIAWVRHYNRPTESPAFVPGTWGSELSPGLGPQSGYGAERVFEKDARTSCGACRPRTRLSREPRRRQREKPSARRRRLSTHARFRCAAPVRG